MNKLSHLLDPILPAQFDKNEIYVIAILFLVWLSFWVIHKRAPLLSKTEIISIYVFNILFSTIGDRVLAEPPLDFYDTLDRGYGELFDSILQLFVYPLPIIIAIHFYCKYKPKLWFYILGWACLLAICEWVSVKFFNLFQYHNWTTWYSFMFYCFAIYVNIFYHKKIIMMIENRKQLIR